MKKKFVPTIQDVAREAGVSPATVSNVLNGRWRQTSKETRARIEEVSRRLNYQPNAMAAALRRQRTATVGVVVTNILNPFYTAVVRGIQDQARQHSYTVLVGNTDDDPAQERHMILTFRAKRVDGILVVTTGGNHDVIRETGEAGIPIVLVDRGDPSLALDTVRVDNEAASEEAVTYLIGLGHRRIGFVGGQVSGVPTRAHRLAGYRLAHQKAGIEILPEYEQVVLTSVVNGKAGTHALLDLPVKPTGLFAANTFLAMGALAALKEGAVRIPEDMSFVMFDDPDWATLLTPPVTTIAQPIQAIGAQAFQLLHTRMDRSRSDTPYADVILPTHLEIRGSCAPPHASC